MIKKHEFGGTWTEEKLQMVGKYLQAYAVIMNKHNFRFASINAFAGTGYREEKNNIEKTEINPDLTLDLPIEQKIIEDNTLSVIYS